MRTPRIALAAATAALVLAAPGAWSEGERDWSRHTGGLPFVVGLERGREECRFTGLPPMLFFTSATDMGCAGFGQRTWKDPDVRAKVAGWTPILVDFDTADAELKKKCRAEFVPTVAWLDHDEKWIWACIGDAPLDIFRKEAEIARKACPKPREPAAEAKLLPDALKRLEDAAAAKDVKAQVAAVAEIRKIRLGEPFQAAARAADERLTKEGTEAVAAVVPVLEDKKATPGRKAEAKKALERLIGEYGADHAVGKLAQEALDRATGRPKPKK